MDLISTIAIIGVVQGFFLGANLLFSSNGMKGYSFYFFGFLLLLLSIHNLDSIFTYTRLFYDYPHFFGIKDPFTLLYGPLIFFYIKSLISTDFKLKKWYMVHFVPFIILLIRIAPLYLKSTSYKLRLLDIMYENYTRVRDIELNLMINMHILIYLIAAIYLLANHVVKLRERTILRAKDLKLLLIILSAVAVIFIINLIRFFTSYNAETILWVPLMISFGLLIMGYKSLALEKSFTIDISENPLENKLLEIAERLDRLMINDQLYLKNELSAQHVAKLLDTNRQYLSQSINLIKNRSFSDYVNEWRVNESKKILIDEKYSKYSLEKIAEDAGFNSFSSFQRTFKKSVGISPAKYRGLKGVI